MQRLVNQMMRDWKLDPKSAQISHLTRFPSPKLPASAPFTRELLNFTHSQNANSADFAGI